MALLRRAASKKWLQELWASARADKGRHGASCPVCLRAMSEVSLPARNLRRPLVLDVCDRCQFVWLDRREYELVPPGTPEERPEKDLPPEAKEPAALEQVRRVAEKEKQFDTTEPAETWHWIPGIFGLPVEEEAPALARWPWLTFALAAVMVVVYIFTSGNLLFVVQDYGLVPAKLWRHGGLTFLTSFFLHAGVWHLVGNVYFLLIFGDNVEDDLGWLKYFLLVFLSAFVGDMLHVLGDPRSEIPCIGASGGISGVITYYALRYPKAQLGFMIRFWTAFRWLHISAFSALLLWFALQYLLAVQQIMGVSSVSALAHLGGAAVGVVAWFIRYAAERYYSKQQ